MNIETSEFSRPATPLEREANERALNELIRLFPRLPKADVGDFLMNCTAFPFADLQYCVYTQAAELSRASHKSVERAYIVSAREMRRSMNYVSRKDRKIGKHKPTP